MRYKIKIYYIYIAAYKVKMNKVKMKYLCIYVLNYIVRNLSRNSKHQNLLFFMTLSTRGHTDPTILSPIDTRNAENSFLLDQRSHLNIYTAIISKENTIVLNVCGCDYRRPYRRLEIERK